MRFVIDTNVLVSRALLPPVVPRRFDHVRRCVDMAMADGALLVSDATLAELRVVLMRPAFDERKSARERLAFLAMVEERGERVEPADIPRLCSDPDDDMFLAVALTGRADVLITHDNALIVLGRVGATRIMRPARFLKEQDANTSGSTNGATSVE